MSEPSEPVDEPTRPIEPDEPGLGEAGEPEPTRRLGGVGWAQFLADFHTERTGITEEVLSRAYAGRQTPYQWLARAVSARAAVICDLACGAGRMSRELAAPGRTVIGLDLSRSELELARQRSDGPWMLADAHRLPFADSSLDAVTTSMGLMVFPALGEVLAEVARVLRPGGVFASISPTVRPLRLDDLPLTARLTAELRSTPRFPASLEVTIAPLLKAAGLTRAEDRRERYGYQVNDEADARMLIKALYLPGIAEDRTSRAVELLTTRADGKAINVPIPIRRIVAVK